MKKLISVITVLMLLLGLTTTVGAISQTVNVKLSLSKSTAKVGEEITVTANFGEDVEAIEQVLTYDSSKVEFLGVTTSGNQVGDDFKDADTAGKVQISWMAFGTPATKTVEYKFKVIKTGEAKFSTATEAVADGNVNQPEKIVDSSVTLNKQATPSNNNTVSNNTTPSTPSNNTTPSKPANNTTPSKPSSNTTPSTPSSNTTPSTPSNKPTPSTPSSKPAEDTNEKPTSIPQAGVNIIDCTIIALFAVVVIAGIIAVVKFKRNK